MPHGPGGFGVGKVREAAGQCQDGRVKHVPRHATGLGQHMHRGFGVALGLVMKALAQRVDLDAAFHHQRPRNQRALRNGPGTVALVAAQVGQPRT
ncbi:hypothetical protein D3C72_1970280 [compost metagenome]